jgi:hypothetical protein
MAAKKREPPKNKTPKHEETLKKAKAIECRKHTKNTRAELLLLTSIMFMIVIFLAFSKYMVRTDLQVNIINQTSECFSDQKFGSSAAWNGNNILMETAFETPDPCYSVISVKAVKQGNRIEVGISLNSGGICTQCFGYMQMQYELAAPEKENNMDIYVDVEGAAKHYVWLPLGA